MHEMQTIVTDVRGVCLCHASARLHCTGWLSGRGGSVAKWLACRTQARKSTGSNRSRDAVE